MKDDEWEARKNEREKKQREWEERQREREKKQKEWEERQQVREKKQREWEERVSRSKSHLDTISSLARSADPSSEVSSAFADMILAIATGGVSIILQNLLGEMDTIKQRSQYLRTCSNKIKDARNYFNQHKNEMIGQDKAQAFSSISHVQERINSAWGDLTENRKRVSDSIQRAREEKEKERAAKQAAWEERQRVRAEKQREYEEKKKAWEERQKLKAEKQKEWEARQKEREQLKAAKQKEWEERQRERDRKQKEWEERQREREQKQREWEERQRERERRQAEWEARQREWAARKKR